MAGEVDENKLGTSSKWLGMVVFIRVITSNIYFFIVSIRIN